jgi:hypothetical protein
MTENIIEIVVIPSIARNLLVSNESIIKKATRIRWLLFIHIILIFPKIVFEVE